MLELLPDNLELVCRSVESRGAASCAMVVSEEARAVRRLKKVNCLVSMLQHICCNRFQEVSSKVPRVAGLPLYHPRRGIAVWIQRLAEL